MGTANNKWLKRGLLSFELFNELLKVLHLVALLEQTDVLKFNSDEFTNTASNLHLH